MNILLIFDDDGEDKAVCPHCHSVAEYVWDDYVTDYEDNETSNENRGMVLCWETKGCDKYSIVDCKATPVNLTYEDAVKNYPSIERLYGADFKYFEIPAAKVCKFVDAKLIGVMAPKKLSFDEILETVSKENTESYTEILKVSDINTKYGLIIRDEDEYPREPPNWPKELRDRQFNVSVDLGQNNYNAWPLDELHPKGFAMVHDGLFNMLRCISPTTGEEFDYTFWGD
jgi:hypothetical protein